MVVAIVTAFANGVGQDLFSFAAGQLSSSSPGSLAAGSLSITESHGDYQFIVPIFNSQPDDQQLQIVGLELHWGGFGCGGQIYQYRVSEKLTVKNTLEKGRRTFVGSVAAESGAAVGANVQAIGTVSDTCGSNLSLAFRPPALIVTGKTTTIISIDLPEKISISSLSRDNTFDPAEPMHSVSIPSFIENPNDNSVSYGMTATVAVQANSGAIMSACEELGLFTSPPLRDCPLISAMSSPELWQATP